MKLITDWGFSPESWKGQRGEYLVLTQAGLMLADVLLPVWRPVWLRVETPWLYGIWAIALFLTLAAILLVGKGVLDLGASLTPLPYPRPDGQLVQTGVYGIVRHPLYSGLLLAAIAWTLWQLSLSHLAGAIVLFLFFDFKASREEAWLSEKYPDYPAYRQRVKKLIPAVY